MEYLWHVNWYRSIFVLRPSYQHGSLGSRFNCPPDLNTCRAWSVQYEGSICTCVCNMYIYRPIYQYIAARLWWNTSAPCMQDELHFTLSSSHGINMCICVNMQHTPYNVPEFPIIQKWFWKHRKLLQLVDFRIQAGAHRVHFPKSWFLWYGAGRADQKDTSGRAAPPLKN